MITHPEMAISAQQAPAVSLEGRGLVKVYGPRRVVDGIDLQVRPGVVPRRRLTFRILPGSPVPVVFDHFGGAQAALGTEQPGFADLVELVRSGKAYVKISGAYRASKLAPDYTDVVPLAKALIAANADRIASSKVLLCLRAVIVCRRGKVNTTKASATLACFLW